MSKTSNRPSHRVYAVTRNGKQSFWHPIGAAWAHGDGEGFNLKLEYAQVRDARPAKNRQARIDDQLR